ncbi:DUF4114 domain-containing protein [Oscillatoria salina IIICB1]|nr:DUF4114 domain-containing protein [Oscillatoria salina IIICB1]
MSAPVSQPVTVNYSTNDGTATVANGDYLDNDGSVTFNVGETTQTITVEVNGDTTFEPDETFTVNLDSVTGDATIDPNADESVGTIVNDDGLPGLSIDNITVDESDGVAVFTVLLDTPSSENVSVDFTTVPGTATEDDYTPTNGTLNIAAGETAVTITVPIVDDLLDELNETFSIQLENPSNATITNDTATATITDDDEQPNISINDLTVNEDDGDVLFSVSLDAPSGQDVSVDYTTAPGSAGDGDFTPTSGTVVIPAGQTSVNIPVEILDDNLDEVDETFTVELSDPSNANIADDTGTATILDNDGQPNLTIEDITVNEDDGVAVFTVSSDAASGQEITVDFTTVTGSATEADFTGNSGTVTIAPGETFTTITVEITDDNLDEAEETFSVELANPSNANIVDDTGTATIEDDDGKPNLTIDDIIVNEDDGVAVFTVNLDAPSGQDLSVDFTTVSGTATNNDFTPNSGTLFIPEGQTTATITVEILDDNLDEPDETFSIQLDNPSNVNLSDDTATATINDNDGLPEISINDVTVSEADAEATFTVSLTGETSQDVIVNFTTNDESAIASADYTPNSGSVTITAGETSATISVPILEDTIDEPSETFTVDLTNATNADIVDDRGVGTITDNDIPVEIAINDIIVNEADGVANFTVSIDQAISQAVTVDFSTADGDAIAENDYRTASGTIVIPAGQTATTISVNLVEDQIDELDETFSVNLANPSNNARFGDNTGIATIIDDDATPTLSFENLNVVVNEADGTITFTLNLDTPSEQDISVDFTTNNGTATGNQDFTPTSGTINIPAGQTTATITVPILEDLNDEPAEEFTVSLSNPVNVRIEDEQATGTIVDNDLPVEIAIDDIIVNEADGVANFTVSIDQAISQAVTVDFSTADGDAIADNDYTPTTGTLTISPGETSATVSVDILQDGIDEADETFNLNLSNPSNNARFGDNTGIATIIDDDATPTLSFENPNVIVNETDGIITFTLNLDTPSQQDISVDFTTNNGTATGGQDFTPTSGTLNIPAGQTTVTITVPILDDELEEPSEDFTISLFNPVNVRLDDEPATGTIIDDETDTTPPVVTINPLTTDDPTPQLTGTVDDPNADVVVTINGVDYPAINNGDGTWTIPDNTIAPLEDGTYDVVVTATDPSGNTGEDETTDELTIDTTPPEVTVNFLTTEDPTPQLTGTVDDPNADVVVTINGVDYPAINNGDGTWTLPDDTIDIPLLNETYDVEVTATDPLGNTGEDDTDDELTIIAPLEVTIDPLVTGDNTPPLTGTVNDPNADVIVTINGVDYPAINNGDGTWTIPDNTIAPLPEGTYDVEVVATDRDGNTDTADTSGELVVDTTPPTVTINPLQTSDRTPELTGTIDDPNATVIVTVNGVEYEAINNGDGTWTLPDDTIETPLDPGSYDIVVNAIDEAGNTTVNDPTEDELIIDLIPPTVTVDFLTTLDLTPQLTGTIDDPNATVIVTVNGVEYEAINNGDGTWTLPDDTIDISLDPDTYNLEVTAIDEAGNVGEDETTDELTVVSLDDFEITPNPNNVFEIDGPADVVARIKYTLDEDTEVSLINELGVFRVNDTEGGIDLDGDGVTDLTPDDEGYLAAALQSGEVVFSALPGGLKDCEPPMTIRDFQIGDLLSYYLVQDGTTDSILAALAAGNNPTSNVFFGSVAANPDNLDHLNVTNITDSSYTLNWEDVVGGGDRDFDDFVVDVEITTENRPLGASLQGEEEQEVFDVRDVTSNEFIRVSAEVLPSTESLLENKVGLYRLVDESGVVRDRFTGNLIAPGEIGYRRAALSQTQFEFGELGTGREFIREGLYAPYIFTDDGDVYFPFLEANPNETDQLLLLGDNTFSFEDVLATSEEDYNDIVFKIDFDTDISDLGITLNNLEDNDNIFQIEGEIGRTANLKFTLEEIYDAAVTNEIGVFVFNDLNGGIDVDGDEVTDFLPGDRGYLEAALNSSQVIFSALAGEGLQDCKSPMTIREFQTNDLLGFYMVTDGTTDTVLAELALGEDLSSNIFFAPGGNQDNFDHLEVEDLGNSAYLLNWEDQFGGGDRDFNDLTVKVEVTNKATPLGAILQGNEQLEVFDLRDLATGKKALAEFTVFPSTESRLDNRAGLYQLADESGRVQDPVSGNLLAPGDTGYQEAAIAQSVVELGENGTNPVELDSGLYAAYFLVDGETAYFPFREANPGIVDQVALLGDNKVGFEDGANGGDLDYNDFVFGVDFTVV